VVQERVREGAYAVGRDGGSGLLASAAARPVALDGGSAHFVEQVTCIQV
jgi:hypothetical protein